MRRIISHISYKNKRKKLSKYSSPFGNKNKKTETILFFDWIVKLLPMMKRKKTKIITNGFLIK
jgi:hypothetical protein